MCVYLCIYILYRTVVQSNVWRFTSFLSSSIFQWSPNCHPATIQVDFATNPELLEALGLLCFGRPNNPKNPVLYHFPHGLPCWSLPFWGHHFFGPSRWKSMRSTGCGWRRALATASLGESFGGRCRWAIFNCQGYHSMGNMFVIHNHHTGSYIRDWHTVCKSTKYRQTCCDVLVHSKTPLRINHCVGYMDTWCLMMFQTFAGWMGVEETQRQLEAPWKIWCGSGFPWKKLRSDSTMLATNFSWWLCHGPTRFNWEISCVEQACLQAAAAPFEEISALGGYLGNLSRWVVGAWWLMAGWQHRAFGRVMLGFLFGMWKCTDLLVGVTFSIILKKRESEHVSNDHSPIANFAFASVCVLSQYPSLSVACLPKSAIASQKCTGTFHAPG